MVLPQGYAKRWKTQLVALYSRVSIAPQDDVRDFKESLRQIPGYNISQRQILTALNKVYKPLRQNIMAKVNLSKLKTQIIGLQH